MSARGQRSAWTFASPKWRSRAVARGADMTNKIGNAMLRRPPFLAVKALLRSMGYSVSRFQQYKWYSYTAGSWCPFHVASVADGSIHTRWMRWTHGGKLQWSDGRDVPRWTLIKYAANKAMLPSPNARKAT